LYAAKNGRDDMIFLRAIRQYGEDKFTWEIIDQSMFPDHLSELEKFYIAKLKCRAPNGYNLTDGGEGTLGHVKSEETRRKLSASMKGKNTWSRGCKLSEETKRKLSEVRIGEKNHFYGCKHSEETKLKLSKFRLGIRPSDAVRQKMRENSPHLSGSQHPMWGKKHTAEARAKMSAAQKGRTHSEETKRRIGDASRGKKHSREHIEKCRLARLGKRLSEETRQKMRDSFKNARQINMKDLSTGRFVSRNLPVRREA